MKVTHSAGILRPQEVYFEQLRDHLKVFINHIECVINSVVSPAHVKALSMAPSTETPATESLENQINTVANDKPQITELVKHLHTRLFNRLYPSCPVTDISTISSETAIRQQNENTSNGIAKGLAYLAKQKKELEEVRLKLTEDFSHQQKELNEAEMNLLQQKAVLEKQLSKLTHDFSEAQEKLRQDENSLPKDKSIAGRLKQLLFFWYVPRNEVMRKSLQLQRIAQENEYIKQYDRLEKRLNDNETRRDIQVNQAAAEEWYLAQCEVLDQAIAKLEQLELQSEQDDLIFGLGQRFFAKRDKNEALEFELTNEDAYFASLDTEDGLGSEVDLGLGNIFPGIKGGDFWENGSDLALRNFFIPDMKLENSGVGQPTAEQLTGVHHDEISEELEPITEDLEWDESAGAELEDSNEMPNKNRQQA